MQEQAMNETSNERLAGAILAAASILSVVVMAHHPSGAGEAAKAPPVHGALIILMLAVFAGFCRFAARRGLSRFSVIAGLVAYGAGVVANLLAATINGLAVPALLARSAPKDLFAFSWEFNQALAYEAVYAISAAFVLWGGGLAAKGAGGRLVGLIGVAAGITPAVLLGSGVIDMHVAGAFIVYAVEAAFGAIIGVEMMRGRL